MSVKAFNTGFRSAMRASACSTTARAETFFAATAAAISLAVIHAVSVMA